MDLKQRFLFAFSMNLRKVRDLSIQQRKKLVPLWIAQASTVVFLPPLIFLSAATVARGRLFVSVITLCLFCLALRLTICLCFFSLLQK
jgi:hypothetical protein